MRRLGEGREAEVFEWGDGRVVRLFREGYGTVVGREATAIRAAHAAGTPVPMAYEQVEHEGRVGLILERIDGTDGITLLSRKPWTLRHLAIRLGRAHASIHAVRAPAEIPAHRSELEQRIARAPHLSDELREMALSELRGLPDGDQLLHGDLHPGNVLFGARGPVIIDWTNATRGDPDADVARSALIASIGSLPPGSSRLLETFDRLGRGLYRRTYLKGYRRARPYDRDAVARWMVPHAAARLAERIPEEVDALLRYLEARVNG